MCPERLPSHVAVAVWVPLLLAAAPAGAQPAFKCITPDKKVAYQSTPCPTSSTQSVIADAPPADPEQRERLLREVENRKIQEAKEAEELGRRRREAAAKEVQEARLRGPREPEARERQQASEKKVKQDRAIQEQIAARQRLEEQVWWLQQQLHQQQARSGKPAPAGGAATANCPLGPPKCR